VIPREKDHEEVGEQKGSKTVRADDTPEGRGGRNEGNWGSALQIKGSGATKRGTCNHGEKSKAGSANRERERGDEKAGQKDSSVIEARTHAAELESQTSQIAF